MSFNSQLNPDVVKTALDAVVFQNYDVPQGPDTATALTAGVFRQSTLDRQAVILEVFKGVGLFETRQEEQDVPQDTPRIGDKITFEVVNFAKEVQISKNFFDDSMFDAVAEMMEDFGNMAAITRDVTAFGIYRGAFTTTLTADGVALISASHVNLNGDTVDNTVTGALSEATLNVAIRALYEQVNQAGVIRGYKPACLLVPSALYKTAVEITDSELKSGTDTNDLNIYSYKYGIEVKQTPYLGAAQGGSDTAWFLLSGRHNIYRWNRQGLETNLVPYQYATNNNYVYKGEYREIYGAITYEGVVGSTGL